MTTDVSLLVLAIVSSAQLLFSIVAHLTRQKTDPVLESFIRGLPDLIMTLSRPEYAAQHRRAATVVPDDNFVRAKTGQWVPAGVDLVNGEN